MTQRTQSLDIRRAPEAGGSLYPDVDTVIAHQSLDLKTKAAVCPLRAPQKVFADVQFLRTLLAPVAGDCAWRKPFANQ
jgi:hypothetical protein